MAALDPSFWEKKATQFAALHVSPLVGAQWEPRRPIRAEFHPDGWYTTFSDNWNEFPHTNGEKCAKAAHCWLLDDGTAATIDEFKDVARNAAVALGDLNTDDAWEGWLDHLRRFSVDYKETGTATSSVDDARHWPAPVVNILRGSIASVSLIDERMVETRIGNIEDVCQASARFCRKLQLEAESQSIQPPPEAVVAKLFPQRAAWLKSMGITKTQIQTLTGVDKGTIQKIFDGFAVTEHVLAKLINNAQYFPHTFTRADIPND